ncbi:hypothetical protein SRHO_G00128680 [Serrasalmus rhombeus]
MYRGPSNPDYRRAPLHQSPYGHPPTSAGPPFSDPFNRPPFPPPYRGALGPISYPSPVAEPPPGHPPYRGPAVESFSGAVSRDPFYEAGPPKQFQHNQPPQGWTVQQTDLQSLEVRKKAEEFLRILEAKDRLELSGQSGEKSTRRQSQDDEIGNHSSEKHSCTRSKSRARSRARSKSRHRSRSRSRGKSRARSRSRGRSRAKSRAKSRARSRSRSRSRSRGKSHTRAKSRARSRSHSRDKSAMRSKSQPRLDSSKDSQWSAKEHSGTSSNRVSPPDIAVPDLFQGLKQVLQSKELEKHLSVVKGALMRNQIPDEARQIQESQPVMETFQKYSEHPQKLYEPEILAGFNQSGLLPHERVGEGASSFPWILSWDNPRLPPEVKPMFSSIEDEEEFLYGEEEERSKPQAVTVPLAQTRPVQSPVETVISSAESPYLTKTLLCQNSALQEPKAQAVPSKQPLSTDTAKVTPEDCEKVKNLLKTIGLNLGMTDISKMAARLKQKQVEHRGTSPASGLALLKPALEALQALSKAPKSDDGRSNRSGSSHSHRESEHREKRSDEKERREKQIQMKRKEYLVKELEGLLKQEGSGDLIPVIGFFCQRCEEFFGDLNSAEGHSACHKRNNTQKKATVDHDDRHKDTKRHGEHQQRPPPSDCRDRERPPIQDKRSAASRIYQDFRERSPERKRVKEEKSPHSSSSHGTDHDKTKAESEKKECKEESRDKNEDNESPKSEKKKKKKEKKMKKKEKKKEKKKKKEKAEKDAAK